MQTVAYPGQPHRTKGDRFMLGNAIDLSRRLALAAATVIGAATPAAGLDAVLVPFASGFSRPVKITHAGDSRLFIVEKDGPIRIVQSNGTVLGAPFLNLTGQVSTGSEQGVLSLAFHPNYASNGFFYVSYTDTSGDSQIVRYTVSGNPDVANAGSALPILSVAQPFSNHNGGDIHFGPDGYLYIGFGDGGAFCDPGDEAQDGASLLGKMLRIDVDGGAPYAIPPNNPYLGPDGIADEIWSVGLRNPWRFSFDRSNGDMYIGDVGQNRIEEIDWQAAASSGGQNYGWDCREGSDAASLAPSSCGTIAVCMPLSLFTEPIADYSHASGCSVTGGYVYRGSDHPALVGLYIYADYCEDELRALSSPDNGATWNEQSLGAPVGSLLPTSFGEDVTGEMYVASDGGTVYRISTAAAPAACPATPSTCTATGKSTLKAKRSGDTAKNKLTWMWLNGPALTQGDFGDPLAGTSYSLCLYAGTVSAGIAIGIPGISDWKAVASSGYKYSDKTAAGDGAFKASLKGGDAGKSKLLVKAKGANLDLAALPLNVAGQLTVQLIRGDDRACWESVFPAASISIDDGAQLKAQVP